MNCSEIQDLAGIALDGTLDAASRTAFFAHLDICPHCRRDVELEESAKLLVRNRVVQVPIPSSIRRSVLTALDAERKAAGDDPVGLWSRIFERVPIPVLGLAVAVAVAAFLLVSRESSMELMARHTAENDVLHQASENFLMIRQGKISPAITTTSPEQIFGYLNARHVPFTPDVRPMDRCQAYSATVTEYHGIQLAHVIYKIDDELLYVYQVNIEEAMRGRAGLTMPGAARKAIESSGWYTDPQHPDCCLVLWEENGTLCAATSTMPKEKMLVLLASR